MHCGALYVRTRNFSYSDLNPTGLSPRTGYFENFQSYSDLITVNFTGLSPLMHWMTIFMRHAMKLIFFMPNNKWQLEDLEWSVLFTGVMQYYIKPIAILL